MTASTAPSTAAAPGLSADEIRALVEEHLPLVQHVLYQVAAHYPRHADREELAQSATPLVLVVKRAAPGLLWLTAACNALVPLAAALGPGPDGRLLGAVCALLALFFAWLGWRHARTGTKP